MLLSRGYLQFGAVVVIVVEYLVRRINMPACTTVGVENQKSLLTVKHKKNCGVNRRGLWRCACGMIWARFCMPTLIMTEGACCTGRQIISLPECRRVSVVI